MVLLCKCNRIGQSPAPVQRLKECAIFQNFFPWRSVGLVHQNLTDCRAGRNWRGSVQQRTGDSLGNYRLFGRPCCYLALMQNNLARFDDCRVYRGIVVIKPDFLPSQWPNRQQRGSKSLCENYDQPLPSVTAQHRLSSKMTALPSHDQRERSMRTVFTHTLPAPISLLISNFAQEPVPPLGIGRRLHALR